MATVLVVDDEPQIRSSLRGILAEEGLQVLEAADGRQALSLVRRERPELVILDIWMPEMDGLQFLEALRDEAPSPAVIMISGHGNIETAVRATKLGAFDFIEKPFSLDGLLRVVHRALDHHAAQRGDAVPGDSSTPSAADVPVRNAARHAGRVTNERTLARSVVVSGHGLHSGVKTGLILQPLPAGSGIQFTNLSTEQTVPALVDFVDSTGYATTLHRDSVTVKTVEHLLATLHAYRVTNLLVKMQGEVPIMDGSAQEFCRLLEGVGTVEQGRAVAEVVIDRRIELGHPSGEHISIEPYEGFCIEYTLKYPYPVGTQRYRFEYTGPESFRDEIAPARTFGFLKDMKQMASMGLASGGRLDNCILIDEEKVVNTTLRFPDELARHKILDIMGDSYLLGRPLRGRITAQMTGHSDNIALLREIRKAMF